MKFRISDVVRIVGGGTPKTSVPEYWGGNVPWISVKDIRNSHKYIESTEKCITQEGLKHSSATLLSKGDVVISARGTVGEIGMINKPMAFNQSCFGLSPNLSLVDPDYLYYQLKSIVHSLQKAANGSVFDTITSNIFDEIVVDLPDLNVQRKVASTLSQFDSTILLNNRINDNLLKQAEAIFRAAFDNSLDGERCISDYILPKRGKPLLSKDAVFGNVPVVAGGLEPATFHNAANTIPPVITISSSGANAGFVNLWNRPVWSSDSSFIDQTMTDIVYFWYLVLKIKQDEIYGAQTGSAQPHIYPQTIGALPIGDLNLQKAGELNGFLAPFFERIAFNDLENEKLARARDCVLPRLLNCDL